MTHASHTRLSRRRLLQIGGAGVAASALGAGAVGRVLSSPGGALASPSAKPDPKVAGSIIHRSLAGTDGWVAIPGAFLANPDGSLLRDPDTNELIPNPDNSLSAFFPDDMSWGLADGQNVYAYGFRDVTVHQDQIRLATERLNQAGTQAQRDAAQADIDAARKEIFALKGHTQNSSPILHFDEGDQVHITLYNLGWAQRVDIPDGHTIHWHGFKNATPWFDGVPEMSGAAPIDKTFEYFYDCQEPGTYMYHCHWEDVEHIQMGMTGVVYIRPRWNKTRTLSGTVTFNATTAVTGAGTAFITEVRPGDLIWIGTSQSAARTVASVTDNTHLVLETAYGSSGTGTATTRGRLVSALSGTGTLGAPVAKPDYTGTATLTSNGGTGNARRRINATGTGINYVSFSGQVAVGDEIKFDGDPETYWTRVQQVTGNGFGGANANHRLVLATNYPGTTTYTAYTPLHVRTPGSANQINGDTGTNFPVEVKVGDAVRFAADATAPFVTVTSISNDGTRLNLAALYVGDTASGPLVVRSATDGDRKFIYNQFSTEYDREFTFMVMDYDMRQHQKLSHIQQPDWTEYVPNAWLLNGRSYPDTVEPPGTLAPDGVSFEVPGRDDLAYQPISSLIAVNAGDTVLLRIASLGYQQHAMTADGIALKVIGRDANYLDKSAYVTDTVDVAPGEGYDVLFTAPATSKTGDAYDTYMFYDRNFDNSGEGTAANLVGAATEIRVYAAGHLAAQTEPNTWSV